jgi:glycine dehydrogenase subunit 2
MASAGRVLDRVERDPANETARSGPGQSGERSLVPLIFEESVANRRGVDIREGSTAEKRAFELLGPDLCRDAIDGFPELSEPQVMRHFLRLSKLNFGQALNFYPLGSCTMKYNPVTNDELAALPGFAALHPHTPASIAQGALELMFRLEAALCEITGMDAASLHPAAGAQGELAGLLIVRAWDRLHGDGKRYKVIIPDTAHGTNPASCTLAGFKPVVAKTGKRGFLEAAEIRRLLDDQVAAMMVTNPNTMGIFEGEILEIAHAVHQAGALLYLDGANLNALLGVAKPGAMGADIVHVNLHKTFSTPHGGGGPGAGPIAVRASLEPFLPSPRVVRVDDHFALDTDRPHSLGKLRAFFGNFGMLVRAYAYMLALGGDGLSAIGRLAILNANYIRAKLVAHFPAASTERSMHECVLTHDLEHRAGVSTLDIAKRLLDFGFHPPTVYFPLVVPGALMVEPTETERRETLDQFAEAMNRIYLEALETPEKVKSAPHDMPLARVDEVTAARKPVLRWASDHLEP